MSVRRCRPLEIISTKYCAVWQCPDCEAIRLQLGNLTLQLTPRQMQGIALGLNRALLRMTASSGNLCEPPNRTYSLN